MIKIKLSIPEPCHENWSNMTPTEKGKHCAVCNKEVFDMTGKSSEEIADKMRGSKSGDVCARIPNQFLETPIQLQAAGISGTGKLGIAGAALTAIAVTPMISDTNNESDAFTEDMAVHEVRMDQKVIRANGTIVTESGEMISGARIIIRQDKVQAITHSLVNGRYVFHLDATKMTPGKAMIKIEKEGYTILEQEIDLSTAENGKYVLAGMKEEILQAIKICRLADRMPYEIRHEVTAGQVKIQTEAIKPIINDVIKTSMSYEVTGGAVVHTVYLEEAVRAYAKDPEEEKINKVMAVFENPNQLKTFPNPATDVVNLEMSKEGNYTIYVFALDGRLVLKENFNTNKSLIDLSAFERGNYLVKVIDNETHESFESKVVLMR